MDIYAVVQFLKDTQKECAVVPLIWLTDNNSVCYWPKTTSDVKFKALVKSNAVYQSSWKKIDVNAVLHIEDNYDAAEQFMNTYIEEVTSSDNAINIKQEILQQNNLVDSKYDILENNDSNITTTTVKRKKKQKNPEMSFKKRNKLVKSPTPVSSNEDSTEDSTENSSTSDVNPSKNNNLDITKKRKIKKHTFINKEKNDTDFLLQRTISGPLQNQLDHIKSVQSSLQVSTAPVKSIQSVSGVVKQSFARLGCKNVEETSFNTMETDETDQKCQSTVQTPLSTLRSITNKIPRINNFVQLPEIEFQQIVLSYLQSIETTYEHLLSKIDVLLQHRNSTEMTTCVKPEGLPELPLSTMEQFEEMEKLLDVEENFNYYRTRLASIGGENQRCCVMSMLRSLLTNKLATHFNWAGRKKIAFKGKKLMDVIYESARLAFGETDGPYTKNKIIENAVKDWLKLANYRLSYANTKKTN